MFLLCPPAAPCLAARGGAQDRRRRTRPAGPRPIVDAARENILVALCSVLALSLSLSLGGRSLIVGLLGGVGGRFTGLFTTARTHY